MARSEQQQQAVEGSSSPWRDWVSVNLHSSCLLAPASLTTAGGISIPRQVSDTPTQVWKTRQHTNSVHLQTRMMFWPPLWTTPMQWCPASMSLAMNDCSVHSRHGQQYLSYQLDSSWRRSGWRLLQQERPNTPVGCVSTSSSPSSSETTSPPPVAV